MKVQIVRAFSLVVLLVSTVMISACNVQGVNLLTGTPGAATSQSSDVDTVLENDEDLLASIDEAFADSAVGGFEVYTDDIVEGVQNSAVQNEDQLSQIDEETLIEQIESYQDFIADGFKNSAANDEGSIDDDQLSYIDEANIEENLDIDQNFIPKSFSNSAENDDDQLAYIDETNIEETLDVDHGFVPKSFSNSASDDDVQLDIDEDVPTVADNNVIDEVLNDVDVIIEDEIATSDLVSDDDELAFAGTDNEVDVDIDAGDVEVGTPGQGGNNADAGSDAGKNNGFESVPFDLDFDFNGATGPVDIPVTIAKSLQPGDACPINLAGQIAIVLEGGKGARNKGNASNKASMKAFECVSGANDDSYEWQPIQNQSRLDEIGVSIIIEIQNEEHGKDQIEVVVRDGKLEGLDFVEFMPNDQVHFEIESDDDEREILPVFKGGENLKSKNDVKASQSNDSVEDKNEVETVKVQPVVKKAPAKKKSSVKKKAPAKKKINGRK